MLLSSQHKENLCKFDSALLSSQHSVMSGQQKHDLLEYDESAVINDVAELFCYDHAHFVNMAYLSILGRPADPQGLRYYLGRLGMGYSKASIIDQLARSNEAKNIARIRGLKELMRKEAKRRSPFRSFFRFLGVSKDA